MRSSLRFFAPVAALVSACGPSTSTTESATDTAGSTATTEAAEATTQSDPTAADGTATTTEATTRGDDPTTSEPLPLPCEVEVFPGDHQAATCLGGPCPISADVELRCGDTDFTGPGVRVAAAPEAMWVATASNTDSMLFRVTGDSAQRITLPPRFARQTIRLATGPAGDLHVASQVANPIDPTNNDVAYLSEAAGWEEQVLHSAQSGSPLAGFQVLPDGEPHIFHFAIGPEYHELVPDGAGGWTSAPAAIEPGGYGIPEFGRDAQGRLLAADMRGDIDIIQLHVEVDGTAQPLGSPWAHIDTPAHFFLAPSASPTPPEGPPFAALIQRKTGIEVAWPLGPDTSERAELPDLDILVHDCSDYTFIEQTEECLPCTDLAAGFEPDTATLARTPDGLAWAVVITTALDLTYEYVKDCENMDDIGCYCSGAVTKDASVSTLHVYRVTLDGAEPVEVLTMPLPHLYRGWSEFGDSLVSAHAQAFGDSLAIGVSVRSDLSGPVAVRALRLELDGFAP